MELESMVTNEEEQVKAEPESRIKKLIKNIGKKLAAGIISVGLALGGAELAFRYYEKHSSSILFMDEITKDKIGAINLERFRYKPHEIVFESKCNSQGYYDNQEFTIAKKPGIKRVVAIADSFGASMIPIRYHAFTKAENLEGKFGNPKWEIYNLSRDGINPEAYLYILKEYSLKYNPDLILMGFFCGNDLHVNDFVGFYNKATLNFEKKKPFSEKIRILKVIKRLIKLHKAGYLFKRTERLTAKNDSELEKLVNIHPEEWWKDINNEKPRWVDPEDTVHGIKCFSYNMFSEEHPNYIRLKEIFAEMKERTNNNLAVILFPMDSQIDNDICRKIILNYKESSYITEILKNKYLNPGDEKLENVDKDRVYNNVRSILKQQNIAVIDLLEPLRQGQKEHSRVYHLNDGHLNYWGNHIAAEEIRKYMGEYFRAEQEKEKEK